MNKLSTIPSLCIDGLTITYTKTKEHLPQEFHQLVEQAQLQPKKAYKDAFAYALDHTFPELDNLLTYLLLRCKKIKQAEQFIHSSYQKYPDYFAARLNYADQCLRKNKLEEIPLIFPSLSLPDLFPSKTIYLCDFRGFMVFLSHYHLAYKNRPSAIECYEKAYLADPTHPSVILLEKKLFSLSFFQKCLKKLKLLSALGMIS